MDIIYETIKKIPGVTDSSAHEVTTKLRSREDLATKADIKDMATKADVAEVKADIEKTETRLLAKISVLNVKVTAMQWMTGLLLIMNVAILMKLFFG